MLMFLYMVCYVLVVVLAVAVLPDSAQYRAPPLHRVPHRQIAHSLYLARGLVTGFQAPLASRCRCPGTPIRGVSTGDRVARA
eukprot:3174814-Rhodomonas_salina.2